jgi:RNA polymerase sigma-70 factor (ECF subfamily)
VKGPQGIRGKGDRRVAHPIVVRQGPLEAEPPCERAWETEFWSEVLACLPVLEAYAERLTHDRQDGHDLLQDTLVKAFRFRHSYRLNSNCGAWLVTIMRNLHRNRCRSEGRRPEVAAGGWVEFLPGERGMRADVEDRALDALRASEIRSALSRLREPYRTALSLAFVGGLTYAEIARTLRVPVGTVKSRVSRGRRFLRAALDREPEPRFSSGGAALGQEWTYERDT